MMLKLPLIKTDKKIKDTHMLTLIPCHVDGEQLTLESLGELVKSPKGGGNATKYRCVVGHMVTEKRTCKVEALGC